MPGVRALGTRDSIWIMNPDQALCVWTLWGHLCSGLLGLGAHSLKQPSLRALPALFLGSHTPLVLTIPREFSLGLYEAEGLEREGAEMPQVGWIVGSLLTMGSQEGSPRLQVTQSLKFLLWTSVSSSVAEGTMTIP